jgi:class 3 adenylate cyclase
VTQELESLAIADSYAVFFDICSSSIIIEDLMLTDNFRAMRNLLIRLKNSLRTESETYGFEVYKFIGDAWILLFPGKSEGKSLIKFLEGLSRTFEEGLRELIIPKLQSTPNNLGLTFGIDKGRLVKLTMLQRQEYVGRALNVASRPQSAIKDKDPRPQYKILFSKHAFEAPRLPPGFRQTKAVTRFLRNIQGGKKYECIKLRLKMGQRSTPVN